MFFHVPKSRQRRRCTTHLPLPHFCVTRLRDCAKCGAPTAQESYLMGDIPLETPSYLTKSLISDIQWRVSRAGGPGGQHINKTNSAVQLFLSWALLSQHVPGDVICRMRMQQGRHCTRSGICIRAQGSRCQMNNKHQALARLAQMIARASQPIKTRKRRKGRTPVEERDRLSCKKHRAEIKQNRCRVKF